MTRYMMITLAATLMAGVVQAQPAAQRAQRGAHAHADEPAPPQDAVAVLQTFDGKAKGTIHLSQKEGYVHVTGEVTGLTPGEHGFHIHEFGDLRDPKGLSAGGHFNPDGHKHGGPGDEEHHAGDLGNITADDKGVAKVDVKAKGLHLHFTLGRSVVVHGARDDLKSQPSGDAGPRVAIGVIGIAQPKQASN